MSLNITTTTKACHKPFTLTLDDCLACSACITSPEANDLNQKIIISHPSLFLVTPFSKLNLFNEFDLKIPFKLFESLLQLFLINKKESLMFDTSNFYNILYKKIPDCNSLVITSSCPGVVKYIERIYPQFVGNLMKFKSVQQIFRDIFGENENIISVATCNDKKLEGNKVILTKDFYIYLLENEFEAYMKEFYTENNYREEDNSKGDKTYEAENVENNKEADKVMCKKISSDKRCDDNFKSNNMLSDNFKNEIIDKNNYLMLPKIGERINKKFINNNISDALKNGRYINDRITLNTLKKLVGDKIEDILNIIGNPTDMYRTIEIDKNFIEKIHHRDKLNNMKAEESLKNIQMEDNNSDVIKSTNNIKVKIEGRTQQTKDQSNICLFPPLQKKIINENFIEYYYGDRKFAKISGLANFINYLNKYDKYNYSFVEAYICEGGCSKGPGQFKAQYENDIKLKNAFKDVDNSNIQYEVDIGRSFMEEKSKKKTYKVTW